MKLDGTFQTVFYDGTVNSSEDFLKVLKATHNYPVFPLVNGSIGAVAWINDLRKNYATAHFCVFKEHWGANSIAMGKAVLKYWFSFPKDNGFLFDVILGVTPIEYTPAIRFIKKIGFTLIGEVPKVIYNAYTGKHSSAMLSYCERPA